LKVDWFGKNLNHGYSVVRTVLFFVMLSFINGRQALYPLRRGMNAGCTWYDGEIMRRIRRLARWGCIAYSPSTYKNACVFIKNEYNEVSIEYTYERVLMCFAQQVLIASPLA